MNLILQQKCTENQEENDCEWPGINTSPTDRIEPLNVKYTTKDFLI